MQAVGASARVMWAVSMRRDICFGTVRSPDALWQKAVLCCDASPPLIALIAGSDAAATYRVGPALEASVGYLVMYTPVTEAADRVAHVPQLTLIYGTDAQTESRN